MRWRLRVAKPLAWLLLLELIRPDIKRCARRIKVVVGDDDARYRGSSGTDCGAAARQVQIIRGGVCELRIRRYGVAAERSAGAAEEEVVGHGAVAATKARIASDVGRAVRIEDVVLHIERIGSERLIVTDRGD